MTEVQKFIASVVGGAVAIVIGVLGMVDPPILALGQELSVAFVIGGLAVLGVGPVRTGYSTARAADADGR